MISEIMYKHFGDRPERKPYATQSPVFGPSSAADCCRKLFYKYSNIETTNAHSDHAELKMDFGKTLHKSIQDILTAEIGEGCEHEKEYFGEFCGVYFHGFLDFICTIGGKRVLVEIKTTYGAGFYSIEKGAKAEHVIQCGLYCALDGKFDVVVLLYIGRDNGRMVEYIFAPQECIDKAEERALALNGTALAIKTGNIPAREFTAHMKPGEEISWEFQKDKVKHKTAWQCSYCAWRDLCWSAEIEAVRGGAWVINGEVVDAH